MKDYMYSRAKVGAPKGNLGGEPDTKFPISEIRGKGLEQKINRSTEEEMTDRQIANDPTPDFTESMAYQREIARRKFEKKDSDLKNAIDKGTLERKVKKYQEREKQMGGSKAVTNKIQRRKKVRELVNSYGTGATVTAAGLLATYLAGKK